MDVITYNTALYAAAAYGSWRGALALLEEMQQVSCSDANCSTTYSTLHAVLSCKFSVTSIVVYQS
jgi:pentatricopeptide repeat protein